MHEWIRSHWDGVIVGVGGLDAETAEAALEKGTIDVAAIGRPLIANPDYLARIKQGQQLVEYEAKKHLTQLV
ncbi:hypothetical protein OKX00_21010 [Fictibacillus sp. KU28468]|nr:hypothetical protein [Fictibacillus sp. KU28468]UZJ78573.1 hypothetical protein OKX00_21010 [Fictibacillus sp. KU28468]